MSLTACPKCGRDTLYVKTSDYFMAVSMTSQKPIYGGLEATCWGGCDQLFWWHPRSGRITRRSKP